jgi:hypothetical protein
MSLYRGAGGASDATDDSTVNAVAGYASAAASSASAAATSATNASNSATAAASSASGAASSASSVATNAANASSSAGLANTYATAASNSKDAAAASATTASTKAGEASTSASNAATSASTATTKASEAATSATNAANSASASASSAASALAIYGNTAAMNAAVAAAAASAATSATYADASNEILSYVNFSRDEATAAADDASAWASASQASSNDAQGYATAALSARDATLAAYDSFDDRYLGVKPLDPTTDNDGNPLIAGTLYFNQVSGMMKLYTGTAWVAAYTSGGSPAFDDVTIAGSTTLSGLTANRIPYLNASKVLTTDASSLTYDGSGNMSVSGFVTAGSLSLSNGTANGVAYLNGSKVLTTGSALTFDGSQLDIPAGSVAAPSLSTTADTNTGIFFPAADTIAFSEGGVEAMRINSSGNLGIGTSSPSYKLHVQSATPVVSLQDTTSAAGGVGGTLNFIAYTSGTSGANVEAQIKGVKSSANAAGELQFFTSTSAGVSTQRAIIDGSGNLGLGVPPASWSGYGLPVFQNSAMWSLTPSIVSGANTYYNAGYKYYGTGAASYYNQSNGVHQWFNAPSGTAGNAITFTQAMTLDSSGNLGIGTTAPATKLDVVGNSTFQGDVNITSATPSLLFSVPSGGLDSRIYNDGSGNLIFGNGTNSSTPTERMRIDSSGNLLVGMTAPATSSAKTIHLANATVPTANPTGGGVLYVEGGALKYRGSSGTVTTIAAA